MDLYKCVFDTEKQLTVELVKLSVRRYLFNINGRTCHQCQILVCVGGGGGLMKERVFVVAITSDHRKLSWGSSTASLKNTSYHSLRNRNL